MNSFKQFIGPLSRHVPPSSVATTSSGGEAVLRNGRYVHSKINDSASWTANLNTFADDHARIFRERFSDDCAQALLSKKPMLSFLHSRNASLDRGMELGLPFRDSCENDEKLITRKFSNSAAMTIGDRFEIPSSSPILETRSYASLIADYTEDMEDEKRALNKSTAPKGLLSKFPFDMSALSRSKQKGSSKSSRQAPKKNKPSTTAKKSAQKRDYFIRKREFEDEDDPPKRVRPTKNSLAKGLEIFSQDPRFAEKNFIEPKLKPEQNIQNLRIVTSENNIEIQVPIRLESTELDPRLSVVSLQLSVKTFNNNSCALEVSKHVKSIGSNEVLLSSKSDKPPDSENSKSSKAPVEKKESNKSHLPWWASEDCGPENKTDRDNKCLNEVYPEGAAIKVELSEEKGAVDVAPSPAPVPRIAETPEESLDKSIKKKKKLSAVAKATKHLEETLEKKKDELKKKATEENKESESKDSSKTNPNPGDPKKADPKESQKIEIKEPKDSTSKVVLKDPRDTILELKSNEKIFTKENESKVLSKSNPNPGDSKKVDAKESPKIEIKKTKDSDSKVVLKEPRDSLLELKSNEKIFMVKEKPFIFVQKSKGKQDLVNLINHPKPSQVQKSNEAYNEKLLSELMPFIKLQDRKSMIEVSQVTTGLNINVIEGTTTTVLNAKASKKKDVESSKGATKKPESEKSPQNSVPQNLDSDVNQTKQGFRIDVKGGTVSTLIKAKSKKVEPVKGENEKMSENLDSKVEVKKGMKIDLQKAKDKPLQKPSQMKRVMTNVKASNLNKIVRKKVIQKKADREPDFIKSSSGNFGKKTIFDNPPKKIVKKSISYQEIKASGKSTEPPKLPLKKEESKVTDKARDPFKPIEKKEDGTLVDYGFTVPTRKPKLKKPPAKTETSVPEQPQKVPADSPGKGGPTTQAKPRLKARFKAEKVEKSQALPPLAKPGLDKPGKGTSGEPQTPKRTFSTHCGAPGDGLLVERPPANKSTQDPIVCSPWLNGLDARPRKIFSSTENLLER